ncbi:hypothetical protein PVAP13_8NG110701 [Panicum virgatum]|uniref:Uncharacterized protein n=1 Tax=Panicum virgatum TaxID=38727 RepID=A0A8T0P984_PANVG|nr:hypothetical protein PVAP13_8NG110701 [Panicum virgatum]
MGKCPFYPHYVSWSHRPNPTPFPNSSSSSLLRPDPLQSSSTPVSHASGHPPCSSSSPTAKPRPLYPLCSMLLSSPCFFHRKTSTRIPLHSQIIQPHQQDKHPLPSAIQARSWATCSPPFSTPSQRREHHLFPSAPLARAEQHDTDGHEPDEKKHAVNARVVLSVQDLLGTPAHPRGSRGTTSCHLSMTSGDARLCRGRPQARPQTQMHRHPRGITVMRHRQVVASTVWKTVDELRPWMTPLPRLRDGGPPAFRTTTEAARRGSTPGGRGRLGNWVKDDARWGRHSRQTMLR